MKVKLKVQLSGTRDGVPWPAVGSVVELPDDEARSMLVSGTASPLDSDDVPDAVVMVPADVKEATEKFVPETARHEPAVPVESLPEEDRRPNMDVIGLADDGEIGHGPTNPPDALRETPSDEPVDMAAEAKAGTRTKTPPKTGAKSSGPLTTKTGPARTAKTDDK
jgi:hypothetical protein